MTAGTPIKGDAATGVMQKLHAFISDRQGAGAIEFALIVPILLGFYLMAFQLTIGLSVAKRASRTAAAVADMVAQQSNPVKTATLDDMPYLAQAMFAPYTPSNGKMKITGVTVDSNGNPTVAWSRDQVGGKPYKVGASVNLPSSMRTPGAFLIHAEVSTDFPLFALTTDALPSGAQNLTIYRQYFYALRTGTSLSCSGC
jgi:Flp pilus assembly protein TadG